MPAGSGTVEDNKQKTPAVAGEILRQLQKGHHLPEGRVERHHREC